MFAHIKQYISSSNNASFLYRGIAIFALLLVFATGLKAQKYYVIYYDDATTTPVTRHYLAISEDGNALTNETTLSPRCYWAASEALIEAFGAKGIDIFKNNNQNGSNNEYNRKSLTSVVFPNKYLVGVNDGNNQTPTINGEVRDLKVATSSDASKRWLLDNEYTNTLVFYYWNYKQYVYYENGWKYSSKGYKLVKESQLVKIEELTFLYPPTITITKDGNGYQITLFAAEGCEIYYTTDGSVPVVGKSSTIKYREPFVANKKSTIKAIAVNDGRTVSGVAEMCLPESHTVSLDDHEDHNWTYYSGVDAGNYKTDYAGKLYSPNPRDVKITYIADDGGAVSVSEPETEFEYYKTLEQGTTVGEYPYTVISNPFSKRPTGMGFGGWKIKSGHQYIKRANGTIATEGERDVLELDESITFINLPSDGSSIAKIEFQATWETAQITRLSAENANNTNYVFSKTVDNGTTYENNFLIIDKFHSGTITINSPCTIMMMEPDGSKDYRGFIFTGSIVPVVDGNTKIESAHWNPIARIDAKGRNFTIGRGMQMDGTLQHMFGSATSSDNVNQTLKVESGRFSQLRHYAESGDYGDRVTRQWVTLGCDYDRAKGDNTKLEFTGSMYVGHYCKLNLDPTDEMCRVYGLSGKFMGDNPGAASYLNCYYMSVSDAYNQGHRYLEIQGGEWLNIAGGTNNYAPNTSQTAEENTTVTEDAKIAPTFTFRMKGGLVKGSVYGGAEYYNAVGTRTFVITGGTIKGWVAGGANGTRTDGGQLYGNSYLYVGGNARVDSNPDSNASSNTIINRAVGGNVFGAGCGYDAESTSGQVTLGTNVVIADNAYVERGVYGGGSYGFCSADKTSYIYITGGIVDGKAGGVDGTNYMDNIQGGIYGGACQNIGGNVNIYMTGGTINGGIYGGSNASGEVTGPITLTMTGGTVENVFGGGNEVPVTGNTKVTITGGEVKQNVYGGGNKAEVKGKTNVVIGQ